MRVDRKECFGIYQTGRLKKEFGGVALASPRAICVTKTQSVRLCPCRQRIHSAKYIREMSAQRRAFSCTENPEKKIMTTQTDEAPKHQMVLPLSPPVPTVWNWMLSPLHAFRLRALHGILQNERFLEAHDPQFKELSASDKRSEVYRFMNLQRNILWIVRFFVLAGAGVLYYFLLRR